MGAGILVAVATCVVVLLVLVDAVPILFLAVRRVSLVARFEPAAELMGLCFLWPHCV